MTCPRLAVLAAAMMMVVACQDTTQTDPTAVAGTYSAVTFTTVTGSTSTDQLAAGARLDITLRTDGTTDGRLYVPPSASSGSSTTASMAGTWTLAENTVTFVQNADSFVRDMPFAVGDSSTLHGDQIFGDTRIVVTLKKQIQLQ